MFEKIFDFSNMSSIICDGKASVINNRTHVREIAAVEHEFDYHWRDNRTHVRQLYTNTTP